MYKLYEVSAFLGNVTFSIRKAKEVHILALDGKESLEKQARSRLGLSLEHDDVRIKEFLVEGFEINLTPKQT